MFIDIIYDIRYWSKSSNLQIQLNRIWNMASELFWMMFCKSKFAEKEKTQPPFNLNFNIQWAQFSMLDRCYLAGNQSNFRSKLSIECQALMSMWLWLLCLLELAKNNVFIYRLWTNECVWLVTMKKNFKNMVILWITEQHWASNIVYVPLFKANRQVDSIFFFFSLLSLLYSFIQTNSCSAHWWRCQFENVKKTHTHTKMDVAAAR